MFDNKYFEQFDLLSDFFKLNHGASFVQNLNVNQECSGLNPTTLSLLGASQIGTYAATWWQPQYAEACEKILQLTEA